jgi:hypothetical protein
MQEVVKLNENLKNSLKRYKQCKGSHILSIPNGHMPLGGEYVLFGLAHTSW